MPASSQWATVYFCAALGCTAPVLEALHATRPEEVRLREHALRQLSEWCIEDDDWFPDRREPDTIITTATHFPGDDRLFRRVWITWNSKWQRFRLEYYARIGPLRGEQDVIAWQLPSRKAISPWNSKSLILQKYDGVWYANGTPTANPFARIDGFLT
jgi:hypothetical protein